MAWAKARGQCLGLGQSLRVVQCLGTCASGYGLGLGQCLGAWVSGYGLGLG